MTVPAIEPANLLDDQAMQAFIIYGYLLLEPDLPPGFNQSVHQQIVEVFQRRGQPYNEILEEVPDLHTVYDHPDVRGALMSILGEDYQMNAHRHCHYMAAGDTGGQWHQDGVNKRHHQIRTVLAMYYPQDVTEDMGPTVILPGTQYHNTPTGLMRTYANFKDQIALTVKAGTVAIVHYDIWHAWMDNRSDTDRLMLKFLFDRTSEPTGPSWNTDPNSDFRVTTGGTWLSIDDQTAAYKHRIMWRNVWLWLSGQPIETR